MVIKIPIFIDSNVFISYFNKDDENHLKAKKIMKDIFERKKYGTAVTSDYVFDEATNMCLIRTKSKKLTLELGDMIIESMLMLNVSISVFQMSWELFKKLKMNFTDCTNIILVIFYGIKNIATFDKEFKKINNINVINK